MNHISKMSRPGVRRRNWARPLPTLLCLIAGLFAAAQPDHAQVIASDAFDYSSGPLAGNNGGNGWGGAWSGDGSVSAGGAAGTKNGQAFRSLATPIVPAADGRVYVAFDMGADSSAPNDFAGLSFYSGQGERVFVGMAFNTNSYGLNVAGIANIGSTPELVVDRTPEFVVGEIIFLSATQFTVNVYVNPGVSLGTPDATYTGPFQGGTWDRVRLSSVSVSSGSSAATFDNLVIGTKFSDVRGQYQGQVDQGAYYQLSSDYAVGKALAVNHPNAFDDSPPTSDQFSVVMADADAGDLRQLWTILDLLDGSFLLQNAFLGRTWWLDGSPTNDAAVRLASSGVGGIRWKIEPFGYGYPSLLRLRNDAHGAEQSLDTFLSGQNFVPVMRPSGPYSGQAWTVVRVKPIPQPILTSRFVRLRNRYTNEYLQDSGGTAQTSASALPQDRTTHWAIEDIPNEPLKRLRNRESDLYLNTEELPTRVGSIEPGWFSARWWLEPLLGPTVPGPTDLPTWRLTNSWRLQTLQTDLDGVLSPGESDLFRLGTVLAWNWWTAQWIVEPVVDPDPHESFAERMRRILREAAP